MRQVGPTEPGHTEGLMRETAKRLLPPLRRIAARFVPPRTEPFFAMSRSTRYYAQFCRVLLNLPIRSTGVDYTGRIAVKP